ncbi:MAG: LptA/OstA family protein [Woeseiaceae bacterium]|nr:LptA/OstA family protein [Woeseiaceae bacterium]
MTRSFVLALLFLPMCALAQLGDSRLPITLDAEYGDVDGKSSMVTLKSLRLSQGALGIEADEGKASELNFNDSVWQLAGNVVITVENGRIECETADLEFSDNELRIANITGAPATFEMTRSGVEETTYAEAGLLRYDLMAGVIEFSENAVITEGGNQIASDYLVYNIREQRIKAQGSSEGDGKVKITFTPSELPETDATEGPVEETDDGDAPE